MKRWTSVALSAALAITGATGCGKKKEAAKTDGTAATPGTPSGAAGPAAAPRADVTSALWAFAPPGAKLGVVLGDGVGARARTTAKSVLDEIAARPVGVEITKGLAELREELGFDPLDPAGWKSIGIDESKGFALFLIPGPKDADKDQQHPIMVLPVVDRAAFRAKTKGKTETVDGKEYDRHEDDLVCAQGTERYVCARTVADLALVKTAADNPLATAVKALPAEARGDFELYADLAGIPDAQEALTEMAPFGRFESAGLSARLEPDGFVMYGWGKGAVDGPIGKALRAAPPRADFAGKTAGAASVTRFAMDPAILRAQAPASIPIAGVDLRTDLVDQLTGEIQMVTSGKGLVGGVIAFGIEDAAKVTGAMKGICAIGKASIGQKGSPLSKVELGDTGCKGEVDLASMAKQIGMKLPPIRFDLKVDGKVLALEVGDVDPARLAGNAADDAGSAETRAMLAGPATFVSWARALDVNLASFPPEMVAELKKDPSTVAALDAFEYFETSVYEIAMAATVQETGGSFVMRVTTFAGDPAEARTAYAAAIAKRRAGDMPGFAAAVADIATKWPASRTGRRAKLESEGSPAMGPIAAVAAAGAASFMQQMGSAFDDIDEGDLEPAPAGKKGKPATP